MKSATVLYTKNMAIYLQLELQFYGILHTNRTCIDKSVICHLNGNKSKKLWSIFVFYNLRKHNKRQIINILLWLNKRFVTYVWLFRRSFYISLIFLKILTIFSHETQNNKKTYHIEISIHFLLLFKKIIAHERQKWDKRWRYFHT